MYMHLMIFKVHETETVRIKKTDKYTIIGRDFNTPHLIDRINTQKISRNIKDYNKSVNYLDLIDLYNTTQ